MTNEERAEGRPGEADALTAATESIDRYGDYPGTAYELARLAVAAAYPIIAAAVAESIAAEWTEFRRIGETLVGAVTADESQRWERNSAVVGDVLDEGSNLDIAAWVRFVAAGVTGSPE